MGVCACVKEGAKAGIEGWVEIADIEMWDLRVRRQGRC